METALRFCGYFGATLIVFGILGSFIVGSFTEQPILLLHIILGALCLVAWGLTSGLASVREAKGVFTGRTARFGAHAVTYGAVTLGLLIVLNIFVSLNEKRWDLTEQGVYSLSPKSVKLIAGIKAPVRIVAIEGQNSATKESTRELLQLYKMANDSSISYELLDPSVKPVEVDTLGMKSGNLIYIEYGEGSAKGISRLNQVDEQSITNAIIKLSRGAQKRLYYVQGHGEPQLESAAAGGMQELKEALGDEHIKVEGLILAQSGVVPEDAAAVVLAAPSRTIPQAERDALISYANKGGRLVLFANPEDRGSDDVRVIAAAFGIKVGEDVILDEQLRLFSGPQLAVQFIAQQFGSHAITTGMTNAEPLVFTFASSVVPADPKDSQGTYVELIKSGKTSWGEQNLAQLFDPAGATASRGDEDLKGPVSIAVALERPSTDKGASDDKTASDESFKKLTRVVVFGDATWIQNGNLAAMGNRDLLLNSVNWALGEEGGVAIGPKSIRSSVAPIPEAKFKLILALSFLGPELILLFGLFVWWRRRISMAA
jgi:ABC-type uncharacterized transport system involved in gliding motility auxiliary subunit